MLKRLILAVFMGMFCQGAAFASEFPEWDIEKWCENASYNKNACVKDEQEARQRLLQRDDAKDLIIMLGKETAPEEQSYVLMEQVVNIIRKK